MVILYRYVSAAKTAAVPVGKADEKPLAKA
jgi:hypothetical protein